MGRRNRRRSELPAPASPAGGAERVEEGPDDDWIVRSIPGSSATKSYRCPGCDQEIPPGVAHVVAWPAYEQGAQLRRHWHTGCWSARLRRGPRVRRSRNAPRY